MTTYLCKDSSETYTAEVQDINPTFAAEMYARRQWPNPKDGEVHEVITTNMATGEQVTIRLEARVTKNWIKSRA